MRDIKFKVWDKINNKMYDYGSDEACELLEEGVDFMGMSFLSCQPNVIWLQYTGLKDKNGKEIYEGDIVTYENFSHAVYGAIAFGKIEVTAGGHQGFYIEWQNNGENKWREWWRQDIYNWNKDVEVIGNIYDNPELLEVL